MLWTLLKRGLLVGLLAGLLAGGFAFAFGEGKVQAAIDIEQAAGDHAGALVLAHGATSGGHEEGEALVSRSGQRGGLVLATALYGVFVGGLFALAFAVLSGRSRSDGFGLSVRTAAAAFCALVLLPFLKYPANPPAVGDPDTIAQRTWLYVALLVIGLVSLLAARRAGEAAEHADVPWRRPVVAVGTFVALATLAIVVLPAVDEVPASFPADLLWSFRITSLGTQAVLWTALGTGFGIATWRASERRSAEAVVAA